MWYKVKTIITMNLDAVERLWNKTRPNCVPWTRGNVFKQVIQGGNRSLCKEMMNNCHSEILSFFREFNDETSQELVRNLFEQVLQLNQPHDERTHEWTMKLLRQTVQTDNSVAHKKDMLAVVLNDFLKHSPALPVDSLKYDEFLSKVDPMKKLVYNIDAVQIANTIMHMYRICHDLIKSPDYQQTMEAALRSDDISELSVEGGGRRSSRPRRTVCNKYECNKMREEYEASMSLITYLSFKTSLL